MAQSDGRSWLEHVRAGESFEMVDWDFLEVVFRAQALAEELNRIPIAEFEKRTVLLRSLFGRLGQDTVIQSPIHLDVGLNIEVGDRSFINMNATLLDTYPIRIGNDVQIGPNCALYPVSHPVRASERNYLNAGGERKSATNGAPIVIEDDVWLGGNVVVIQGVTIGARSTIGAGSVVTRSIPPDVFAAGNPCRVIRSLA
jgi:maltose O-acetyltransferase